MKSEFIWNYHNDCLVNVDHIVKMSISAPILEQKDWCVVAYLAHAQGSVILHRGNEKSCEAFLSNFNSFLY